MAPMADAPLPAVRTGLFNYMANLAEPSLYRNGKVLTRRNRDGSDARWEGVDLEERRMPVVNGRTLAAHSPCTLATRASRCGCVRWHGKTSIFSTTSK